MAKLVYFMNCSLDGYIEDENGNFGWGEPDREVHEFINEIMRPFGTYLYGRRIYEVMRFWERPEAVEGEPHFVQEFGGIWRQADKIVFSRTLETISTARTRIETEFDPLLVRQVKEEESRDLAIEGAELAMQAVRAGLVDELRLLIWPVLLGGGKAFLSAAPRTDLDLIDERSFRNGTVHLHYRFR